MDSTEEANKFYIFSDDRKRAKFWQVVSLLTNSEKAEKFKCFCVISTTNQSHVYLDLFYSPRYYRMGFAFVCWITLAQDGNKFRVLVNK